MVMDHGFTSCDHHATNTIVKLWSLDTSFFLDV